MSGLTRFDPFALVSSKTQRITTELVFGEKENTFQNTQKSQGSDSYVGGSSGTDELGTKAPWGGVGCVSGVGGDPIPQVFSPVMKK